LPYPHSNGKTSCTTILWLKKNKKITKSNSEYAEPPAAISSASRTTYQLARQTLRW
jgi:hypothetical protein